MQGRIIKGIAGFYYVYVGADNVIECKAKGAFRNDKIKPLVGDFVDIDVISEKDATGNIVRIMDRTNELLRPQVANVDQALVIFALKKPEPNFVTLDKMIIQYASQNVPVVICFNKEDLADEAYCKDILKAYSKSGCTVLMTSADTHFGIDELKEVLKGKLTVIAGPSGVGKSSLTNIILDNEVSETGEISSKLKRGKHTTRHSEIFPVCDDTFIMDTPGFGSFDLFDIDKDDISSYYQEFSEHLACRFVPCSHTHEPDCEVKASALTGSISKLRYDSYVHIYNEQMNKRRY